MLNAHIKKNAKQEENEMTDDRRPTEAGADSLAALYRLLEDAWRYEGYAEAARRAYDEELADFFREVREESRGRVERLADGGVH